MHLEFRPSEKKTELEVERVSLLDGAYQGEALVELFDESPGAARTLVKSATGKMAPDARLLGLLHGLTIKSATADYAIENVEVGASGPVLRDGKAHASLALGTTSFETPVDRLHRLPERPLA